MAAVESGEPESALILVVNWVGNDSADGEAIFNISRNNLQIDSTSPLRLVISGIETETVNIDGLLDSWDANDESIISDLRGTFNFGE